jgi:hypothetical protein
VNHLVPCPECSRHVRVSETECPFCALPLDLSGTPEPQLPKTRLGRAATFAFSATLASVTAVVACGGEATETSGAGAAAGKTSNGGTSARGGAAGVGGATAGGLGGTMTIAPPYGLPPMGGFANETGGSGVGGAPGLLYGAPPFDQDAGTGGVPK